MRSGSTTPQGKALAGVPPIEIVKLADGDPVPFRDSAGSPSTEPQVLHISSPWYADTLPQHLGVDGGKHAAYLDLRHDEDMATMRQLAATTDVFASTYRPAVNERFGPLPGQLAAASERGVVYMSANAYGHSGPWKDRPGFDQDAQVASGFAMAEGAIEGGSYQVKLSLARSAMWVQELGLLDIPAQGEVPETHSYPAETVSIRTAYGAVTLPAPPLTFTTSTARLVPYGADPRHGPDQHHLARFPRRRESACPYQE